MSRFIVFVQASLSGLDRSVVRAVLLQARGQLLRSGRNTQERGVAVDPRTIFSRVDNPWGVVRQYLRLPISHRILNTSSAGSGLTLLPSPLTGPMLAGPLGI